MALPLELSTHLGAQSIYCEGDGAPAELRGVAISADVGLRLDPRLAVFGGYEHVIDDSRSDRLAQGSLATGDAVAVGVRLFSSHDAPVALLLQIGLGYRWLRVPYDTGSPRMASGTDRFEGLEPLRLHVGPTIALGDHLHLDLLAGGALGRFRGEAHPETCAILGACKDSLLDSDTASSTHFVVELVAALRWGL